jgi:ADP-ribosyl-[dinitrogen reductase] hydrolase
MLLEIAIGDAYGAGFEFAPRAKIARCNDGATYVGHELGIPPGHYTDDTQMSVAVAEVLLRDDDPDEAAFADAFVAAYRRDPRAGYSSAFGALLAEVADGGELRRRIRNDSRRNGAAMRSVPLGLVGDVERLRRIARRQARVTHDTPEGRLSSEVVALMAHGLIHRNAAVADLAAFVERHTGFVLRADWADEVEVDAIQTIHAVHTALARNRSQRALLEDCVEFGGDTDSVAAIALGLAALSADYAADLPATLYAGLEDGAHGRRFLEALDAALAVRAPALRRS